MSLMFDSSGFTSLNLSSFDTSKVVTFEQMFSHAYDLVNITYGPKFIKLAEGNKYQTVGMFNFCPANKPTDPSWNF